MEGLLNYLRASSFLGELKGKIALVKSDFNVPLSESGSVADDFRIAQAAPFVKKLIEAGVVPLLATHLGRPKGYDNSLTLDRIVEPLSRAVDRPVEIVVFDKAANNYADLTKEKIYSTHKSGKVAMLENIRFHSDESGNKGGLAKILAGIVDVSIQNSFGTAHREEDTSVYIHEFVPGFAGDLLINEIEAHRAIKKPQSPYVVIVGGDKPEDSLQLMRALFRAEKTTNWSNMADPSLNLCIREKLIDAVLVGGHLMYPFIHAQLQMISPGILEGLTPQLRKEFRGLKDLNLTGYSIRSDEQKEERKEEIRLAKGLLRLYNNLQFIDESMQNKRRLFIPPDYAVLRNGKLHSSIRLNELLDYDEIVDIGARSQDLYAEIIKEAKTVVWNGPLGLDDEKYARGTRKIIEAIDSNAEAVKEVGGGSTNYVLSAYESFLKRKLNTGHRSTGGGSTLLETAFDSPTAISLMMSRRKLLEGNYGPGYEDLRNSAIKQMTQL